MIDIVVDDFEQPRAATQSFRPGKLRVGLKIFKLDRIDVVGAGKRIGTVSAGLGFGRLGAADLGESVTQSIMPTISSAILRKISSGVVPLQVRFKYSKAPSALCAKATPPPERIEIPPG